MECNCHFLLVEAVKDFLFSDRVACLLGHLYASVSNVHHIGGT